MKTAEYLQAMAAAKACLKDGDISQTEYEQVCARFPACCDSRALTRR